MERNGVTFVSKMQIVDRWDTEDRDLQRRWLHHGKNYGESSSRGCFSIIDVAGNCSMED